MIFDQKERNKKKTQGQMHIILIRGTPGISHDKIMLCCGLAANSLPSLLCFHSKTLVYNFFDKSKPRSEHSTVLLVP